MLGILLLALGGLALRVLGGVGTTWWQREASISEQAPRSLSTAGLPEGNDVTVYGVLAEDPPSKTERSRSVLPASTVPSSPIDHVFPLANGIPIHFLNGRLSIRTYQTFRVEIPPHMAHPRLEGSFRTLEAGQKAGRGCAVEVALMNEGAFQEFARNEESVSIHFQKPATHADIQWDLTPTYGERQQYHLVFRNASIRSGPAVVDADFRAKFE